MEYKLSWLLWISYTRSQAKWDSKLFRVKDVT